MNNQKQFGVWMDNHHATIVGNGGTQDSPFTLLAHVKSEDISQSFSEKSSNNHEIMVQAKFFKEIASHLVNATDVHITGTGQAQEQFIHYLAATPQYKNCKTAESTSNKMSDEKLLEFIAGKF